MSIQSVKTREECRVLVTNHTWVSSGKSKGRMINPGEPHKKHATSHQSNISTLVAKTVQNEIVIKKLNKHLPARDKTVYVTLQLNNAPTHTVTN